MAKKKSAKKTSVKFWYVSFVALVISLTLFYVAVQKNNSDVLGINTTLDSTRSASYKRGPTPTQCKNPIESFTAAGSCDGGFSYVSFICKDGTAKKLGSSTSCKPVEAWFAYAKNECKNQCIKTSIAPKPGCTSNSCPQLMPPAPNYCINGRIVTKRSSCGCPSFECVTYPTTTPKPRTTN